MKFQHICHLSKVAASLPTALILLAFCIGHLLLRHWLMGVLCMVLAALFFCIAGIYGTVIHVDEAGVRASLLGKTLRSWSWDAVGEIGVVGTRVFNGVRRRNDTGEEIEEEHEENELLAAAKKKGNKYGTMYIYFSQEELTEAQRFDLALKWPPMNMIFLQYAPERCTEVRMCSGKPMKKYNVGNLKL